MQQLARLYENFLLTPYSTGRQQQRKVPHFVVIRAIRDGKKRPGHSGRLIYELSSRQSPTGRGVKVIVEQNGNRIDIITVIDKGTKFKVK